MIKNYKIRIYPTKEQEDLIWKHFGCCRFTYNYMLNLQNENYKNGNKYISRFDMIKLLTPLKKEEDFSFLNEVSNSSLQIVCSDLDKSFKSFFKKQSKCPKFKSKKRSKTIYPCEPTRFYFKDNKYCQVQKLGKLKYKTDYKLPIGKGVKFSNVRLSYKLGKYFLSFGYERENQTQELNDYSVGIDLGIKELAVVSYDDNSIVYHNINKSKKVRNLERRLKLLQRSVSRKYEQNKQGNNFIKTKNIEREELKIKKIQDKLSNIRDNYIHQTTHDIVSLLPKRVVMEDLNVTGMTKNKHLSKAIQQQCFNKFITYMKYKCENNGIKFVQVDRFYPSSKTCSKCGNVKKILPLSNRTYTCDCCGNVIDRDLNAAINLEHYLVHI